MLTGGTALAEFDLDFFTGVDGLVLPVSFQVESRASAHPLDIRVVRRLATYFASSKPARLCSSSATLRTSIPESVSTTRRNAHS